MARGHSSDMACGPGRNVRLRHAPPDYSGVEMVVHIEWCLRAASLGDDFFGPRRSGDRSAVLCDASTLGHKISVHNPRLSRGGPVHSKSFSTNWDNHEKIRM